MSQSVVPLTFVTADDNFQKIIYHDLLFKRTWCVYKFSGTYVIPTMKSKNLYPFTPFIRLHTLNMHILHTVHFPERWQGKFV